MLCFAMSVYPAVDMHTLSGLFIFRVPRLSDAFLFAVLSGAQFYQRALG